MRLLEHLPNGNFRLTDRFLEDLPPYAILSHTWGKEIEEVIWLGPPTIDTNVIMHSMQHLQEESISYVCSDWKMSDDRWVNIWQALRGGRVNRVNSVRA